MTNDKRSSSHVKSRAVLLFGISVTLFACSTTVDMQYLKSPPSNDYVSVAKRANNRFEYVELSRMYIKVAPQDTSTQAKPQGDSVEKKQPGSATPDKKSSDSTSGDNKTDAGSSGVSNRKGKAPGKGASPSKDATATQPKKPSDAKSTDTADSAVANAKTPPADPDAALKTTLIDGKKWAATVVPIADENYGFWVRGVQGYWKTTTLSVARYDNSDVVSSVSVKAENLVAKRLGQFAGVAAAMVKIAGEVGIGVDSAGIEPQAPLLPFSIEVPESGKKIGDLNDGWSYSFQYDSDKPVAGAIGFDAFMTGVADTKVAYWPVLACRTATLTLFPPNNKAMGHNFAFNIVVAHPDVLRLQPVPVDGKLTLGAICGASETGTQTADSTQTIADDFSALQQGIQKVTDAKNTKKGSGKSTSSAGSSAKETTKSDSNP